MLARSLASLSALAPLGVTLRSLAPALTRTVAQVAPAPAAGDPFNGVQSMNLTPDQAARVRRAAHLLHTELRLTRDDMLRLLPAVLRAPHFVQNRVRWLRSLGLENAEVARLVQAAPDLLALPPVVGADHAQERMRLLGLPPAALHSFVLQAPASVPLLLKSRLTGDDIRELRGLVAQLAEGMEQTL